MTHYYLDSSALVKRYVTEAGTVWVNSLCAVNSGHTLYTVRISGAEIIAAVFRRAHASAFALPDAQAVARQFKADFRELFNVVEVTSRLVDSAMTLAENHRLRGYDSVQLAAALELQSVRTSLSLSPITFVCADDKLNAAAMTEGIQAENPNNHP